jgi:hypothetical protein
MTKQTKILLIIVAVVFIAAVFFFWPKKENKSVTANEDNPDDFTTNNNISNGNVPSLATTPINASSKSSGASGLEWYLANVGSSSNTTPQKIDGLGTSLLIAGSTFTNSPIGIAALGAQAGLVGLFPLKQGSRGEEVKVIQRAANNSRLRGQISGAALVVDGIWGAKTTAAVKQVIPAATISLQQYQAIAGRVASGAGLK